MLELNQIKKDYITGDTAVHALKGIDLKFRESEFVAVLGHSGCGKTTLIRCLNGLIPGFYEGKVTGEIFLRDTSFETLERP